MNRLKNDTLTFIWTENKRRSSSQMNINVKIKIFEILNKYNTVVLNIQG